MKARFNRPMLTAAAVAFALLATGLVAVYVTHNYLVGIRGQATRTAQDRQAAEMKLQRATEEEREIRTRLPEYERLLDRGLIGVEDRLDWVDEIVKTREKNQLPDLRYTIAAQRPLAQNVVPAATEVKPLSSEMTLNMQLLHEGDLFRVLADLRRDLPPHVLVRECQMDRSVGGNTKLRADCKIDLVTIDDSALKGSR